MTGIRAFATPTPEAFLSRAGPWLRAREDHHNLLLGLVATRAVAPKWPDGECFAIVESDDSVIGCVVRTPPYKALLTDLPPEAGPAVADLLVDWYDEIPAMFGPRASAEAVADAWTARRGGTLQLGMPQGLYRLDAVHPPTGVSGRMRLATAADIELVVRWGEGFGRDTGIPFPPGADPILRWIEHEVLFVWEDDGEPVSVAVAHGRTEQGVRIGYVYSPPERRGKGYASALVAALSQAMLDAGFDFCVLYTDLTNPTSNAIYQRVGYRIIAELIDVDLVPASGG